MGASVSIEESQLGPKPWAVIITRSGERVPRTLWDRYASQVEAEEGVKAARAYLAGRPLDLPKPVVLGVDPGSRDMSALAIGTRDASGRIHVTQFIDDPDVIAELLSRPTSPPAGDR